MARPGYRPWVPVDTAWLVSYCGCRLLASSLRGKIQQRAQALQGAWGGGRGAGAPGHSCVFSCFLGRHGKGNAGCPLRVGAGITHAHRTAPAGKVLVSHGEQMSHPQSCCRWSGIPHGGFHCSGGARPSRALPHRSPLLLVSLSKTQPPAVIISLSVLQLMQRSNVPMREDCRGTLSLLVAGGHGAKVTEST